MPLQIAANKLVRRGLNQKDRGSRLNRKETLIFDGPGAFFTI